MILQKLMLGKIKGEMSVALSSLGKIKESIARHLAVKVARCLALLDSNTSN